MKSKEEIVQNWLPRYTGKNLEDFGEFILLTNFSRYVQLFAEWNNVEVVGADKPMPNATANNITIINFGMGSPVAATMIDLLSAIKPKAVLFLGKCGGLKKKNQLGDFVLPIAAIRGEGTSNDYFPPEVPAMPFFCFTKSYFYNNKRTRIKTIGQEQFTLPTVRVWEHDEEFKDYLRTIRAMAIDMETATIFQLHLLMKFLLEHYCWSQTSQ
jgi:AMP nucleosidase